MEWLSRRNTVAMRAYRKLLDVTGMEEGIICKVFILYDHISAGYIRELTGKFEHRQKRNEHQGSFIIIVTAREVISRPPSI
jgi:hypothetical protein